MTGAETAAKGNEWEENWYLFQFIKWQPYIFIFEKLQKKTTFQFRVGVRTIAFPVSVLFVSARVVNSFTRRALLSYVFGASS